MANAIIFLLIGLFVGCVAGYLLKRPDGGFKQKNEELRNELDQAKSELSGYKEQVADHFLKTADLVNNMTDSYRAVHEHLAAGATHLCSEQLGVEQLDIRQTHLLDKSVTTPEESSEQAAAPEDPITEEVATEAAPKNEETTTSTEETIAQPADAVPESVISPAPGEKTPESDTKTVH